MDEVTYSPLYSCSRAIIIGIDIYKHASPLGYALSDAKSIAQLLNEEFEFPQSNIILLENEKATRDAILDSFLQFAGQHVGIDDRIVFFFAGHGHTITGRRGEVGYLVPNDGNLEKLSTLIRWDELTRNADLIPAKHIVFIMDACYGGLAITRALAPGSMRFLKDMLLRHSRQVLTAGKANEVVADSGGPLPDHSIFTGHLIEALKGKAANEDGIITANGVMSYVYERVATDHNSRQTPHYGFIDGDGDFIFKAPILNTPVVEEKMDEDTLISVPSAVPSSEFEYSTDIIELTKQYLSDTRYRIKLHDLVAQQLREALALTSEDNFAVQGSEWSVEEFTRRLKEYEAITENLQSVSCCISYWGDEQHYPTLKLAMTRLTDRLQPQGGLVVWSAMRWYPVMLLLYSAGISALASENYHTLAQIFFSTVGSSRTSNSNVPLTLAVGEAILDIQRSDAFKQLPGHERHYVPRSEYLFKLLQPKLDDLLFLGRDYELLFDKFEVFLALTHADSKPHKDIHVWGPIGRFGWKYHNRDEGENPLKDILIQAEKQKENWEPLRAGFFGGNYEQFKEISGKYKELVAKLDWW